MRKSLIAFLSFAYTAAILHAETPWQGFAADREQVSINSSALPPPPADAPYRNPDLPVERRIDDLLPRLNHPQGLSPSFN